jgi:PAS domain S-box-containing protein
MKEKIKSLFIELHPWQIVLFSMMGAVIVTNLITTLISLWFWHEIQLSLIVLGTINALFVPLIILPIILRMLRKTIKLEEQNQTNKKTISQLEEQRRIEESAQQRASEISLLYQLGILLASGKDLHETLLTLQREILKLIQADLFFVAIYDENTDIAHYPIFFESGKPEKHASRHLGKSPGLTGPVVYKRETLYLMNFRTKESLSKYVPADDNDLTLHSFLGIPLMVNEKVIGVLSVQSKKIDAYSRDQIQLMEHIAVQAALAIDKARLFDQFQEELEERKCIEAGLHQREAILEAITFAAEKLLKMSEWRVNINAILEHLGKTINATHAYLFEHQVGTDQVEYSLLKYEWTAPDYPSDFDNPYYQTPTPIRSDESSTDYSLRQGQIFMGNRSTFPPFEKERLLNLGVKAMVEVPLFVDGKWWGTFGFDDLENEREWSNAEVDALKIAAGILSAAIQRQKADAAGLESERIYRQAIEAADAVPYYLNYESKRFLFMGEGIREMTGYGPEEMNPQVWSNITEETVMLGEAEGISMSEAIQLVRQGKIKAWKSDQKIKTRDGQIRWVADRSVEIFEDKNISIGSIGILQDITERKLVEASLRKRESILEAVTFSAEQFLKAPNWRGKIDAVLERLGREFNASHAYLFEKHPGKNGILLNSLRYEWTAPGQKQDIDNPIYQNAPMHEKENERYYHILDSGEPFVGSASFHTEAERTQLLPTGIKALLEMRIVVNGKQWGTLGFDDMVNEREWDVMEVDVIKVAANVLGAAIKRQMDEEALKKELMERERAEQALRYSEEKFSKAFHTTQVMMTIEDEKNIFIDVNRAFLDAFSVDRKDVVGHSSSELNIFYDPADTYVLRQALQERDFLKDFELRFRRNSSEMGIALLSSEKFHVDDAEYTLTSALDITERKQAEAEREKLIDELEAKNEELERFAYTVSHDLKSPLVTINGFLGYLERDAASGNMERLKKDTYRIQDAVKKMQRLLNELLELSRIGRMMNAFESFSAEELVNEALDILHGRFEERKVTVQIQPNLPAMYGDRQRLLEVLQNLLDNAAKYMGNQTDPHIEIGYLGDEKGKQIFYVRDNGIGIAPEYHELVFGLFNKLDSKSEGTGVGLALVKRIIEVHGGRIWLESEVGKSSTFFFTLARGD